MMDTEAAIASVMAKSRPVCARMRSVSPLTFSWGSSISFYNVSYFKSIRKFV